MALVRFTGTYSVLENVEVVPGRLYDVRIGRPYGLHGRVAKIDGAPCPYQSVESFARNWDVGSARTWREIKALLS